MVGTSKASVMPCSVIAFITSAGPNMGTITCVEPTRHPAAHAAMPAR